MRRHRSCQSLTQQKAELTPEAMATVQPEKDLSSTWCVSSLACAKHPECLGTGMRVLHTAPDQRNRIGDFDSSWALCTPPPLVPARSSPGFSISFPVTKLTLGSGCPSIPGLQTILWTQPSPTCLSLLVVTEACHQMELLLNWFRLPFS